jgi:hypothetical protein
MNTENFHVLKIKYIGQTGTRGARVSIKSERFKQVKLIEFNSGHQDTIDNAVAWLESHGFKITGHAEASSGFYLISSTFKPLKP